MVVRQHRNETGIVSRQPGLSPPPNGRPRKADTRPLQWRERSDAERDPRRWRPQILSPGPGKHHLRHRNGRADLDRGRCLGAGRFEKKEIQPHDIRPETVTFATVRYGAIAGLFRNRTTVASLAGDFSSTGPSRFPLGHSSGYA